MPDLSTLTPGPDIIYVLVRGAAQGPKAGLAAAAGLCTGILGHIFLAVVGFSAILAASTQAFLVVKLAGAAYLLYLGVRMWLDRSGLDLARGGADKKADKKIAAIYRQTILMNLLNPKVALFFLALLPQFVDPAKGSVASQFLVLGVIFLVVSFCVMATAGFAGGQLRRFLARSEKTAVITNRVAGSLLILLGLRLAFVDAD